MQQNRYNELPDEVQVALLEVESARFRVDKTQAALDALHMLNPNWLVDTSILEMLCKEVEAAQAHLAFATMDMTIRVQRHAEAVAPILQHWQENTPPLT